MRASCQPPFEKLQKLQWIFNQMGRWRSSLWSAPSLSPSFQTETWNPEDKDCIWKIFVWSTLDIFFICLEIVNNEIQRKWSESFLKWSFENKWCRIWKRCHGSPFGLNLRCYLFVRHPEEQLITLKVAGGTPLSNLQRTPGGKTLTLKKTWEWTNSPFWHFIPTQKCEVIGDWLMIWNETKLWFCCSFQWTHELTSSNRQYTRFTIYAKFTIFNSFLSLNNLVSTQLSLHWLMFWIQTCNPKTVLTQNSPEPLSTRFFSFWNIKKLGKSNRQTSIM